MPAKKRSSSKKTTKKVTPKKVVKKVRKVASSTAGRASKKATKKAAKTKSTDRVLLCAPSEHCFWTSDGQVLQDLLELRDALKVMDLNVYGHHVTKEKNDFADWVEQILDDLECAAALRKARKPHTARTAVVRYLKLYKL